MLMIRGSRVRNDLPWSRQRSSHHWWLAARKVRIKMLPRARLLRRPDQPGSCRARRGVGCWILDDLGIPKNPTFGESIVTNSGALDRRRGTHFARAFNSNNSVARIIRRRSNAAAGPFVKGSDSFQNQGASESLGVPLPDDLVDSTRVRGVGGSNHRLAAADERRWPSDFCDLLLAAVSVLIRVGPPSPTRRPRCDLWLPTYALSSLSRQSPALGRRRVG